MTTFYSRFLGTVLLLLLSLNLVDAQTVNVNWGPLLKDHSNSSTSEIIGSDSEGFFALRTTNLSLFSKPKTFLDRYNHQNNLIYSKELRFASEENGKADMMFNDIRYLKGQLVAFTSYLNKEQSTLYIFGNTISKDGVVSANKVELAALPCTKCGQTAMTMRYTNQKNGGFDDIKSDHTRAANMVFSPDSSKILIYQKMELAKRENEKFSLNVVDNKLNKLYNKVVELPMKNKDVFVKSYTVDNEGNAFALVTIDNDKEAKKSGEQELYYRVISYRHATGTMDDMNISLAGKFITDANFILDNNHNLLVGGFYADNKKLQVSGMFFLTIDPKANKVISSATKQLTPEMLANFMPARRSVKDEAGVKKLKLQEIRARKDGSVLLVAEQKYLERISRQRSAVPSGGFGATPGMATSNAAAMSGMHSTRSTTLHYHSNGMVLAQITPQGTFDWMTVVPKRQHTTNDQGLWSSYSLVESGDKLHIIYNDNPKNLDPRKIAKMRTGYDMVQMRMPAKSVSVLVTVNPGGSITKTALFPAKEAKTVLRPHFNFTGPNNVIIYSGVKKNYRFGTLKFS